MARISLEELYRGEGAGSRYNIIGEVMKDLLTNSVPREYDEDTWREMLLIKHTLTAAEKMKNEGDFVSGLTDTEPLSSYAEGRDENT